MLLAGGGHTARTIRSGVARRQGGSKPNRVVASSSTSPAPATKQHKTSFHHGITYISYEANTCGIKFNTSGVRVLIDPWFVGELTFGGQDWVYRGRKRVIGRDTRVNMEEVLAETDVMVITQGLPDHCHIPTLTAIQNKAIPVVANPEAAPQLRALGYTNVTVLSPGQATTVKGETGGRLRVQTAKGALVGPPWSQRQLALLLREEVAAGERPASVYFESHCDADLESVRRAMRDAGLSTAPGQQQQAGQEAGVDVAITPVVSSLLGVPGTSAASYALVQGDINLLSLMQVLRPQVLLPLMNHEIDHAGPMAAMLWDRGSSTGLEGQLRQAGLGTRVEYPAPPGEALAIAL